MASIIRPTRRAFATGLGAVAAAGGLGIPAAWADVDYKRFKGVTLEANLIKGPRGDLLQRYAKEFTDLTGITVESEVIPEQQQRQKAVIELSSGKPSFDIVHVSYHVQKRQFDKAGWLADLSGFMKDPSLTDASLNEGDFSAAGLTYAKNEKGELRSLPWSVDYFIVYYNKEIFAKKNVAFPTNFEELVKAAETLTDAKDGTFGFVGRGLRNANMALWGSFFLNYGGEFLDAKGNILTDGPEAVEATKLYQRLLTKSAPPGRRRVQLDGIHGGLQPGQGRHVARRRRLGTRRSRTRSSRGSSARSATCSCRRGRRASSPPPTGTASG